MFTFALGDRALYEFMNDNPCIEGRPVSYVNDPRVISQQDRFVSINSTLEIDLTGQCNSECLGGYQYSGAGGQVDFVRGAFASRGGKSVMVLHSTASDGTVTRIVPRLHGPVTTGRMDTHWVVTEHGAVCLKGKSEWERDAGAHLDCGAAVPRRAAVSREADAMDVLSGACSQARPPEWRHMQAAETVNPETVSEALVLVERRGNVGLITLNRPKVFNALSDALTGR